MASAASSARHRADGFDVSAVPANDRGLLDGDGVFRTLRIERGWPWAYPQQVATLQRDAARLSLNPAPNLSECLLEDIAELAGADSGVLRVTLTRGSGPRGYAAPVDAQSRRLVSFTPGRAPLGTAIGTALGVAATPLSISSALAGVKHLGRLDQVLAASEVMPEAVFDRLMLDGKGALVCGTRCNVFLRHGDVLHTPALDRAGVAGVMRTRILAGDFADVLGPDARFEIGHFYPAALERADEVFVTNSVFGVQAVGKVITAEGLVLFEGHAHRAASALVRAIEAELDET